MTESTTTMTRKPNVKARTKVKTGCATCRIRKIKCDEGRPSCERCVKTGRSCDGYDSPFRVVTGQRSEPLPASSVKLDASSPPIDCNDMEITLQDIDNLNRCFSTKTLFDIKLNCDHEARQILQAGLTDPSIRHALLSLRALREDLETFGDDPSFSATQQTAGHHYGLQQYGMALGTLASNLSLSDSNRLKSALLCCQIFISIEQLRKNHAARAQHIIRGLRIMHEYRARPSFVAVDRKLLPAWQDQLPFLDVFIIKVFAAPCKFADAIPSANSSETSSPACSIPPSEQSVEFRDLRTIAPNMRTELVQIAGLTLDFLDKVSRVESVEVALQLLHEKAALLESLDSWLTTFDLTQTKTEAELVSVSFMRMFHRILKIILLGALDSSPNLNAQLQVENDRLQDLANDVEERVKSYITYTGSHDERAKRSPVR